MLNELKFMIREFADYRELFYYLTLKEIKTKYKQSIIGIGWAIFMPLVSMVIFTFIFTKIAKVETDVPCLDGITASSRYFFSLASLGYRSFIGFGLE